MAKLTATSIAIPDVAVDVVAGPVTEKIAYHDIKLDQVNEGKIGSLAVAGATISVASPQLPAPFEGTLGALTATNLDLGLYARMITQARTDANQELAPLYDTASFEGMQLKSGDMLSISVGKMSASGVKGRPFLTSIVDLQK